MKETSSIVFVLIIFVILSTSCKKEKVTCYHCTFGAINGATPPPQDYCGDDGGTRQFKDAQGNDLSVICRPK